MLSIDTNILLHAFNEDSPSHAAAYAWLTSIQRDENVAISEFILAELYGLLRNPAVIKHPLDADEAVEVIQTYRRHPRWKVLWADLVELCEDETESTRAKPHFMGSLVTVPTRSVPEGVTKFLLIDGQQRLTTLQVLLAALRDSARGMPGSLAEKLEKSQLVNQFEEGLDHFKLLPTQTNGDRKAFLALIQGESVADSDSRVAKAYTWFQKKLKSRGSPDAERLATIILRRLSLVSIVLDHDDNPHLIFESLNYKGEPLTQGDLIRNYFLMRVPVVEQEKLFQRCWEPMQLRLKEELSEFVRHFLMRQG